jgi:penicillin-binding protein 1A
VATQTLPRRTSRKHAAANGPRRPAASAKRRNLLLRFWWVWVLPLVSGVTVLAALSYVYAKLPLDLKIKQDQTTTLFDRDGNVLTTFDAGVDRQNISIKKVPIVLRQAVIAAEDEDFYTHSGVDLAAIVRAAWSNLTGGEIEQGGSTITQQYVRNVFPEVGTERTVERKIKEALLAIKLERRLGKNEILERYLNTIYLGNGAYGVEAASKTYFRTRTPRLNLVRSALLAGIISGPESFDPIDHPVDARIRRDYVLERMAQLGFIPQTQAEAAMGKPIKVHEPGKGYERLSAAYYIDWTRRYLQDKYHGRTFTGGLEVDGTLDPQWQSAAQNAVESHLSLEPRTPAASLVAIDVDSGQVRAMIGGRGFHKDQTNLATGDGGTGRQAGSAFKPFTLMAAIEQDISLQSTFAGPSQVDMSEFGCGNWVPQNYGGSSYGTMDLVSATASSVNTIFAQLVAEVGPENVARTAHRMGIDSALETDDGFVPCSITLGTLEVTPLEMTEAFATFASLGLRHEATPVARVKGPGGRILEKRTSKDGKRVADQNDALQAVHAMKQVLCCGTAAGNSPGFDAFGKTGTTDDEADVWFCGASTEVAACVWVGHPEGRVSMPGYSGGAISAPIWRDFMVAVHQNLEPGTFPAPSFTGAPVQGEVEAPIIAPSPEPTETEPPDPEPTKEPDPPPSEPPPTGPPSEPPPTSPPPTP